MVIKVNTTRDDSLGKQLLSIKGFLSELNSNIENDLALDFSNFSYAPPLLAVFFGIVLEKYPHIQTRNISGSYLSYIKFPDGLKPDLIPDWEQNLQSYSRKSYLPLINFNTSPREAVTVERNNVISHACQIIKHITKVPVNYYTGISYLISELSDNIVDHSRCERGWLSFQFYPSKGYIDFCIGDSGVGLLGAYQHYTGEQDYSNITTHIDAMDNVIKGISTKNIQERGYGVHTSREMLISGLKGQFILFSGNALLYNYNLVDFNCLFSGTIAVLRISGAKPDLNFNYNNYVE
ncbi:MAG: hypothetical protein HC819_18235 [Cyclobacteriaceae bacterium]|nr:hypothetical protein [Cyclobacteriaceae bacterium]